MYDVRSDIYTYNRILIEPWKHIPTKQHSSLIWEMYTVADKRLFFPWWSLTLTQCLLNSLELCSYPIYSLENKVWNRLNDLLKIIQLESQSALFKSMLCVLSTISRYLSTHTKRVLYPSISSPPLRPLLAIYCLPDKIIQESL